MKHVKGCAIETFKQVQEINGGGVSAVLFHQVNCQQCNMGVVYGE